VATFNVENLFARPKALDTLDWKVGRPILAAYQKVNVIMGKAAYSDPDRVAMRDLLVKLDVYYRNEHGAIRRRETRDPQWAWLRKNRGNFDRQPVDPTRDVEIVAVGRDDWIGWVELATETVDELSTRMTGRVITDVNADILAVIEVEDRPTLSRFNDEMLNGTYEHVRLIEGNDTRGIDVGLMTKPGFEVESMQTHVDLEDNVGRIFSRDCAHYAVRTPSGPVLHVLVNHFKSQSGGGGTQRQRQAAAVRSIATELVDAGESVVVLGDLNEGPETAGEPPTNLATLFDPAGPLRSCYDLPGFDVGPRLGTFDSCGLSNRLDYIFISADLPPRFRGGSVFRSGL
jgi:endonuclease/exonuclease/phosphatase family metal-dependent hydrolase